MTNITIEQAEYSLGSPEAYAKKVADELLSKITWEQRISIMGVQAVVSSIFVPGLLREYGFPPETYTDPKLMRLIEGHLRIAPEGSNAIKPISRDEAEAYWNQTLTFRGFGPEEFGYVSLGYNQFNSLGFSNFVRSSNKQFGIIYPLTSPLVKSLDRGWFYFDNDAIVLGVVFEDGKIYGKAATQNFSEFTFCIPESEADKYFSDEVRV